MPDQDLAQVLVDNVAATDSTPQSEGASASGRKRAASDVTGHATSQAKRVQVLVACESCRQKKIKCDAGRPCSACARRNITCHYDAQEGETHSQAVRRRHDKTSDALDTHAQLFRMLADGSEEEVKDLLHWIRQGNTPETVLAYAGMAAASALPDRTRRLALDILLVNLAHSTGSLRDIVRFANSRIMTLAEPQLPDPLDCAVFCNRVVRLQRVHALMMRRSARSGGRLLTLAGPSDASDTSDLAADVDPPHRVPANPWTSITESDEAVSHLVSLFLAWLNPTWRFVEQDLFLSDELTTSPIDAAMRSRRVSSDFCSPLLMQSEHAVAFAQDDDRVTRGQNFHDEALRLWVLEGGRPSLVNVQALCVLGLESNYRAKDHLGLDLITTAKQLSHEVFRHDDQGWRGVWDAPERDYVRARLSAYWSVRCQFIIVRIAFMVDGVRAEQAPPLPKIQDVFDDQVASWTGYPLTEVSVAHRPTLYLRERCKLAELFYKMPDLIFTSDDEIQQWYQHLPLELHYTWPMSVEVGELHASYLAVLMIFWLAARNRFQSSDGEDEAFGSQAAQETLSRLIPIAHTAAAVLRDFRERYGLKICPAWLLQLQAVAAGVLLLDPELGNPPTVASPPAPDPEDPMCDSHTAFDEVFRCLIGTGVEVMIARGIARMTYHTASDRNIPLSRATRSMLQLMSGTACRPSDLKLVNSRYPNFATIRGHEDRERMTELLEKWERLDI